MFDPDVPCGFGAIKIRGEFVFPLGKGKFVRGIKVSKDSAIMTGRNISYNSPFKIEQVVLSTTRNIDLN